MPLGSAPQVQRISTGAGCGAHVIVSVSGACPPRATVVVEARPVVAGAADGGTVTTSIGSSISGPLSLPSPLESPKVRSTVVSVNGSTLVEVVVVDEVVSDGAEVAEVATDSAGTDAADPGEAVVGIERSAFVEDGAAVGR